MGAALGGGALGTVVAGEAVEGARAAGFACCEKGLGARVAMGGNAAVPPPPPPSFTKFLLDIVSVALFVAEAGTLFRLIIEGCLFIAPKA
jgi:hypothetical protein